MTIHCCSRYQRLVPTVVIGVRRSAPFVKTIHHMPHLPALLRAVFETKRVWLRIVVRDVQVIARFTYLVRDLIYTSLSSENQIDHLLIALSAKTLRIRR